MPVPGLCESWCLSKAPGAHGARLSGASDPWRQCQAPTPSSVQREGHGLGDSRLGLPLWTLPNRLPQSPVSSPTARMIRSAT